LHAVLDAQRMQQVLINLLSNAVRYCNRPPAVVLRAWRDASGWLLIQVEDNGIGIPAEDQARVFDRFFQVARGNTRRPGGTGLGLAIARGIVVAHGGSIDLTSVPGEGSVFTLRLPPPANEPAKDTR
jgi:signal transduction histidine kinase